MDALRVRMQESLVVSEFSIATGASPRARRRHPQKERCNFMWLSTLVFGTLQSALLAGLPLLGCWL